MADKMSRCMFMDGLLDSHMYSAIFKYHSEIQAGKLKESDVLLFCMSGKNNAEIIDVLLNDFNKLHPNERKYSAAMYAIESLSLHFPCQNTLKS